MSEKSESKPDINVTPLIDILLVLLIIFMAISPLKPARFEAKIPAKPKPGDTAAAHIHTLVVRINADATLELNAEKGLGTINEPQKLSRRLAEIFQLRLENGAYAEGLESRTDLAEAEKIQKTVFVKAPRLLPYGEVVKVIDSIKIAGASPISLQIDRLD
jgi:biopolymer transport protein ExbD